MGCPDPYGDLLTIIHKRNPAAYLDIGAFQGTTVVKIRDESSIPIHAFEPSPDAFTRLAHRFKKDPNIYVHNLALSHEDGYATMCANTNPQTNSLLATSEVGEPVHSGMKRVGEMQVTTRSLDSWMEEFVPDGMIVVKADIQGAEGQLLDGGKLSFRDRILALYSEAQIAPMYDGQIDFFRLNQRLAEEAGLVLHETYPCMHDKSGRAIQTDALWIRPDVNKA